MNWRVNFITAAVKLIAWLAGAKVIVTDAPVTVTSDGRVVSETSNGSTSDTTPTSPVTVTTQE